MPKTQEECVALLEQIRWQGEPQCPYCGSRRASRFKQEQRHHCNECFTSFSVTVGTLFHGSHIDLPKWFRAIGFVMDSSKTASIRQLALEIEVNKNTASYVLARIRKAQADEPELLRAVLKLIKESKC